jgi:hypothetical protein
LYSNFKLNNTLQEKTLKEFSKINNIFDELTNARYIHIASLFDNFSYVANGQSNKFGGLNINNFESSLKSCCNDDNFNEPLCLFHYKQSIIELKNNYRKTLSGYNNTRNRALWLSINTNRILSNNLYRNSYNIPIKLEKILEENIFDEQEYENLYNFSKFLSLYAMVCRLENRKNGELRNFLVNSDIDDISEFIKIISYLLGIGENIFLYFLLFWEIIFRLNPDILEE